MRKTLYMHLCKKRLAKLWFIFSGIIFFVVLFQTFFDRFGLQTEFVWRWLVPTIFPSLVLIISVYGADVARRSTLNIKVDNFVFLLAFWISFSYLCVVLLHIAFIPIIGGQNFLELLSKSHLWLGPMQGLVAGILGVFFTLEQPEKQKSPTSQSIEKNKV